VTSSHGAAFPVDEVTGPVLRSPTFPRCHPVTAAQLGSPPLPKIWHVFVDARQLAEEASPHACNEAVHSSFVIVILEVIVAKIAL
jgi:hypothetical protein